MHKNVRENEQAIILIIINRIRVILFSNDIINILNSCSIP